MNTPRDQNSPVKLERPVNAILLFDGVEVLDFAGPYEGWFGRDARLREARRLDGPW